MMELTLCDETARAHARTRPSPKLCRKFKEFAREIVDRYSRYLAAPFRGIVVSWVNGHWAVQCSV